MMIMAQRLLPLIILVLFYTFDHVTAFVLQPQQLKYNTQQFVPKVYNNQKIHGTSCIRQVYPPTPTTTPTIVRSAMSGFHTLDLIDMTTTSSTSLVSTTAAWPSSSIQLSVDTLDPTTFLSNLFGTLLGTPAILAIPIVAALGVATLIAYLIVSYASPAEDE